MFPAQASLEIGLLALIRYAKLYPDPLLNTAIADLAEAQDQFAEYYQLFRSIQWNRSRVAVKREIETQLKELAQKILQQIELTGADLNHYHSLQRISDVKRWNKIIYHLILTKQWLSNNLLNDRPKISKFKLLHNKSHQPIKTIQLNLL